MVFTKYHEIFEIDKVRYLFNTNNGALIELDDDSFSKIENSVKSNDFSEFSTSELEILKEQEFIVDDDCYQRQTLINRLNYNLSKYSLDKDEVKIDFALTNNCNFCCPYCFEKDNLGCGIVNRESLIKTGETLFKYIKNLVEKHSIKRLKIVYYGGEPTLEKDFIIEYGNKIKKYLNDNGCAYRFNIITNGFLLDEEFLSRLNSEDCEFIQVTIDGDKDFHNSRRTNKAKINTFDKIVNNVNLCSKYKLKTVIRLNIDKTNVESEIVFLDKMEHLFKPEYLGKYIFLDIARVFGSENSYDLYEFEDIRKMFVEKTEKYDMIHQNLNVQELSTFCIAESVSRDLVIDNEGKLYRCWNNVFDDKCKINTLDDVINNNYDPYDKTDITLDFVESMSLNNVNNGKCFECKYIKYCHGLCPRIRKSILEGIERNIYKDNECQEIMKKRISSIIKSMRR